MRSSFWSFIDVRKNNPPEPAKRVYIRRILRGYLRKEFPRVNVTTRERLGELLECSEPRDVLITLDEKCIQAAMLRSIIKRFGSN